MIGLNVEMLPCFTNYMQLYGVYYRFHIFAFSKTKKCKCHIGSDQLYDLVALFDVGKGATLAAGTRVIESVPAHLNCYLIRNGISIVIRLWQLLAITKTVS